MPSVTNAAPCSRTTTSLRFPTIVPSVAPKMDPVESIKQDAAPAVGADGQPVPGPSANPVFERLKRLFMPDPRVPEHYVGKFIATKINDRLGPESEEAKLGESINLCIDVLTDGSVGDLPPIAHLGWSSIKFVGMKKRGKSQGDPKMAANQPAR